ncbi:glutamate synthase domain-containing protein 2 [Desulfitispora alkaliphila]
MQLFSNIFGGLLNEASDDLMYKMMKDKYTDNMLMMMATMKKMSFFNGMELLMRATQGESLERPLGSHLNMSPWEMLFLNPVHLHRLPIEDSANIDTSVIIGPDAEKPLELSMPISITGMSYGSSLNKKAKIALAKAASEMGISTNTGESGLLTEERETATKLIGQYNRGGFLNTPDKYKQLDAIEIQLGQGA